MAAGSMMSDTAHAHRRMSFNADAMTYHRGRPPYPATMVFRLLADRCGLRPGTRVLEIGAGTGLAIGPFLAAGEHVVAVEPGANLAAILAATLACDHLEVIFGDFETADLQEGSTSRWRRRRCIGSTRPPRPRRSQDWFVPAADWRPGGTSSATPSGRHCSATSSMRCTTICCPRTRYRDSRAHVLDTDRWRGRT